MGVTTDEPPETTDRAQPGDPVALAARTWVALREEADRVLRDALAAAVAEQRTERDIAAAADAGAQSVGGGINRAVIRRLLGKSR